jgi:hypothetical protein
METIINLIVNNGIGVVCVAYMIYFQLTTMKEMSKTMQENTNVLKSMDLRLSELEKKNEV